MWLGSSHGQRHELAPAAAAKVRPQQRRPKLRQWLWYSVGGGLPPELSQWVLRDTTGSTWWLRHLARSILQLAPFILAVLLFLPAPLELRAGTAFIGAYAGLSTSVFLMWGVTEHRLVKAGFASGVSAQAREERVVRRQHERMARYAREHGQGKPGPD